MTDIDVDHPLDPPAGSWQEEHLSRYVRTGGEDGHIWNGAPTLLLTTRDRELGRARRTGLIYGRDGDRYLVVASAGGRAEHPIWYQNLSADPEVLVQVFDERFPARARSADPDEKPRLWQIMTGIWPAYDDYQAQTEREIPLVIIERV
ncbi:nitroreductase family deazaflavin-dependent oxidoreductase [Phytohabitans houttuyneae]|uniref:Nitroreductase n=1 Tax=Phytohabitans houttuyneae TaxID=1076126 RepID=A0A6V8JYR5_9ACTN|nr:nitroreductase [Phytohabitans houttuyneae]